ncbi:MAG: AI-2E family transporter, partial [Bacillota bacterium]|nr:AI-2E family transporter [Bacillota bacterium]
MKIFNKKSRYVKAGLTAFIVVAASILFYFGLDYLKELLRIIGAFLRVLSPFFWGLGIAYLLNPIMGFFERKLCIPVVERLYRKHPKMNKGRKLARGIAVFLAVIAMLLVLSALFYLIVPQTYDSIKTIATKGPEYINGIYESISDKLYNHPDMEKAAASLLDKVTTVINGWVSNKLLPGMENTITNITTGVVNAFKTLYNFIIGVVVAIYILSNKENFVAYCKKLMYSLFSKEAAVKTGKVLGFMDRTFMDFLVGNSIDAVIIGLTCYLFCIIFKIPYPLLISVIVGITNFIPFFGPFIGAIPSGLLILLVDPMKCLIFIIFCIVIQQIDATYIKPKIFGGTFGINGFWVIFSIIFFGGLFGFWGMLLGVPMFVVIYEGISILVNRALEKKNLPNDAAEYRDLDYVDPETGEMVRKKPKEENKKEEN